MILGSLLFLNRFGPLELGLILIIVLLIFGGKKIPSLMKGIGKGIKEFKTGIKGEDEENKDKEEKK
ncbi:MAG: twin-arginine translocase TatA/TatE family subunit [Saprospiraceae bacterium]|nr:twin-arginine translocase TatA/TatE family subunit [Saprospiraceae bacterium]